MLTGTLYRLLCRVGAEGCLLVGGLTSCNPNSLNNHLPEPLKVNTAFQLSLSLALRFPFCYGFTGLNLRADWIQPS